MRIKNAPFKTVGKFYGYIGRSLYLDLTPFPPHDILRSMPSDINSLAQVFKALSDPTRLRILSLLQTEALCVMDIVTILGLPQPTISRHLAYLQKTNLIKGQKKGLWHFYALNRKSLASPPLQAFLKTNFRSFKQDQKKSEALHRKGGCCPKTSGKP